MSLYLLQIKSFILKTIIIEQAFQRTGMVMKNKESNVLSTSVVKFTNSIMNILQWIKAVDDKVHLLDKY